MPIWYDIRFRSISKHMYGFVGYVPQDIGYSEFRDAPGITCAADLLYEGEVGWLCCCVGMPCAVYSLHAAV